MPGKQISTPNFDHIQPQLCLNAKLRRLHRLLNGVYMQRFAAFDLRGSMLSMLFIIGKKKRVSQRTLAEALVLDESTISRDVFKLLKKGWVAKERSEEDARSSLLSLTTAGLELLEEVSPIWAELHHNVEAILGEHHITQIDAMIHAIETNVPRLKE